MNDEDGIFERPAWLLGVASNSRVSDDYRGQKEFFRSLLGSDQPTILV